MVTIKKGIVGTFVFRNEGDGCLNAKYMNEDERLPYGETCVLRPRDSGNHGFAGAYPTTWFEQNQVREAADLTIIPNNVTNAGIANTFVLEWRSQGTQNLIFRGVGMMYGELLVGAYWEHQA